MSDSASGIPVELRALARSIWWLVLIRGILAVVFGVLALALPTVALLALVFTFAAYAIVDGVANIAHSFRVRGQDARWGWLLAQGIVSVIAGIVAFIFPLTAGFVFGLWALVIIGIYAIMMGISGIPASASIAAGGSRALGYVLAILSIVAGIVILIVAVVSPLAGILNLIWLVGVYAIIFGVLLIVLAIQARRVTARVVAAAV